MEFISPPPNNSSPIFVFIVINEEGNYLNKRNTPSSSLSSSSQDSAICESTTSSNCGDISSSPPPDPRQVEEEEEEVEEENINILPSKQHKQQLPLINNSFSSSSTSFISSNKQNNNNLILLLNWGIFDPNNNNNKIIKIEKEEKEEKGEEFKQIKLDINNIFEKLKKFEKDLENIYPTNNLLIVCNKRSIRQLLYPLCAQAFLTKLANDGEEQAFSALLPLPKLFHCFVPYPLFDALNYFNSSTTTSTSPNVLNNEKQQNEYSNKKPFSSLNQQISVMYKTFKHFYQLLNIDQFNKLTNKIEKIQQGYQSKLCTNSSNINPKTIIRARGLPWQVSDLDVALFFAGLEIAKGGIILCLGPEGRRNGECIVQFETSEYREWALERHKCNLRQRYIELYRSSVDDFVRHAIGIDRCALNFAQLADQQSQKDSRQAMIIRMRGLPFTATEQQIREFFSTENLSNGILPEGILFVHRPDGRPSGDAFVLFCDEESGRRALLKHRQRMGPRYIELFRTTQAEVQQLFNAKQQIIVQQEKGILTNNNLINQKNQTTNALTTTTTNGIINSISPIFTPSLNTSLTPFIPFGKPPLQLKQQNRRRDCLKLRGLPYEAQVQQVVEFMGQHARNVLFQGVHMIYTSLGHPSGEAFIQMESEHSATKASHECHNKYMEVGKKRRYIEVFQCSADDLSLQINFLPQSPPLIPPLGAPGLLSTPPPLFQLPSNVTSPLFTTLTATNPFFTAAFASNGGISSNNDHHQSINGGILLTSPQFSLPLTHFSPEIAAQFGGFPSPQQQQTLTSPTPFWFNNNNSIQYLSNNLFNNNNNSLLSFLKFNQQNNNNGIINENIQQYQINGGGGRGGGGGGTATQV